MAEIARMTVEELGGKVLADEHGDWLREAVAFLADALMEAEVEQICGAGNRERSPERTNQRIGYRPRTLRTRVGEVELASPKLRQGSYFPSFLAPRKMSEQAPRAGAGCLRAGSVRQRRLDAQG
jgi:putative transposase